MKTGQIHFRAEKSLIQYLESAARYDHKTLSGFVAHAALAYADSLRGRGWKAKYAPVVRDARRKASKAA